MTDIFCVKCKNKTDTLDLIQTKSKNNRNMLKGKCVVCGTIKNKFLPKGSDTVNIKSTQGGNLNNISRAGNLNSIINKLPIEMHLPGHNFTGPGTNLKKRLKDPYGNPPDFTPKEWSKPINRVDEAAMNHDICYLQKEDRKTRNEVCDKKMLEDLNIYNPTLRERVDRSIVGNIIKTKLALGMGVPVY